MTIPASGIAGTLHSLLSDNPHRQNEVGILIPNQPQQYRPPDATMLALTMISLVHATPHSDSAESMLEAVDSLDMNLPVLPAEVAEYAATLDRISGPSFIELHCANIVDEANDHRPDRARLGTTQIMGPDAFLREVRSAFETGYTDFTRGSPAENEAITLAASLGQLPRTYDLRG